MSNTGVTQRCGGGQLRVPIRRAAKWGDNDNMGVIRGASGISRLWGRTRGGQQFNCPIFAVPPPQSADDPRYAAGNTHQ